MKPSFPRMLAAELRADFATSRLTPLFWGLSALAAVVLSVLERGSVPAPLLLSAAKLHSIALLGIAGVAATGQARRAAQSVIQGNTRPGPALTARLLITALALVALHAVMRSLGMPPLPHPVSTTLALAVSAFAAAALGLLIGHALSDRDRGGTEGLSVAFLLIVLLPLVAPALSPLDWSRSALATALTGTGTRAAASPLLALTALGLTATLALKWPRARWPLISLGLAWAAGGALVWLRPAPPPARADMAIARLSPPPPASGSIAPIATTTPDPALSSALGRIKRQIATWPPAAAPDPTQRARNLLLIAAVPDLYDSEPLQSHLPALVRNELASRIPAAQLSTILHSIATHPDQGDITARTTLPHLGLPASTTAEAPVRNRMALYAVRLGGGAREQITGS